MNCELHLQPIIGYYLENQQKKRACTICLAQQTDFFEFNDEANQCITQFMQWFWSQYNSIHLKFVKDLIQVQHKIQEIKSIINLSIDQIMTHIQDWITEASIQKEFHEKYFENFKNLNFDEQIKQVNKVWKKQEQQFKKLMFKQISSLLSQQQIKCGLEKLKEIWQISQQMPFYNQSQIIKDCQTSINLKCNKDNQLIIMMDINQNRSIEDRLLCIDCISRYQGQYISIQESKMIWNQYERMKEKQLNLHKNSFTKNFTSTKELLEQLKSDITSPIDQALTIINQERITIIEILNKQQLQIGLDWQTLSKDDIQKIAHILSFQKNEEEIFFDISKTYSQQQDLINQVAKDLIINLKISQQFHFNKILKQVQCTEQFIQQTYDTYNLAKKEQKQNNSEEERIHYQLLNKYSIQETEHCRCLSLNKENNILVVGCLNSIKIFEFLNERLTQIQVLSGHLNSVTALQIGFSNQIYSCSDDMTIKIWGKKVQEWQLSQELKEHTNSIWCIVVNKIEDQLITGGKDSLIKCFIKTEDQWKCVQTLKNHSKCILVLSLNESQNQLLTCGEDQQLNIFEYHSNNQWLHIQSIITEDFVFRAAFINDTIIGSQLVNKGIFQLYKMDTNKFIKKEAIEVDVQNGCCYYFPLVFSKKLGILVSKNHSFINIIRIKKGYPFLVEQTIEYQTYDLYGTISDDGQYLITWDNNSKQIQVRQLE